MTLPLHGVASYIRGFEAAERFHVRRIRAPDSGGRHPADIALARSIDEARSAVSAGFLGSIVLGNVDESVPGNNEIPQLIILPDWFGYLNDGDIIGIEATKGRFRTLYRRNSSHNSFLITERCNHYCLMCSQPPRDVDDGWIFDEIRACLPLIDPSTCSLGFTGGEPLLDWRRFVDLLRECKDLLPNTSIHVLSNGRAFASSAVVDAWAEVGHSNLTVGIPVYSAVDHVHDYVVQARGSFDETVLGILKLKDRRQCVELRVVLHAITAPRIVETCEWIARNLPFLDHVALMGLENTGFAIANESLLWIDPIDYREELAEAVAILAAARVNTSVYNLPLCVLARSVWPYAIQSISDWKNGYVEECAHCIQQKNCSGFFTSGRPRLSRGIKAIVQS